MDQQLTCTMVDHYTQNKLIEGICNDEHCHADKRIACVTCILKFHENCQRKQFLTKEEIIGRLKGIQDSLKVKASQSLMNLFQLRKCNFIKTLNEIEESIKQIEGTILMDQIDQINKILETQFTEQVWNQCYQLINKQQVIIDMTIHNQICNSFQSISDILLDLEKPLLDLKKQRMCESVMHGKPLVLKISNQIPCIDFSPDGQRIVCAIRFHSHSLRVYDVFSQTQIGQDFGDMNHHCIKIVRYSPNGQQIISTNKGIQVWDSLNYNNIWKKATEQQYEGITSISISPDSQNIISVIAEQCTRIFQLKDGKLVANLKDGHLLVSASYSSNHRHILTGDKYGHVSLCDAQTLNIIRQLNQFTNIVTSVIDSPNGLFLASACFDGSIYIQNRSSGKWIESRIMGQQGYGNRVFFSKDSKYIITSSGKGVKCFWETDQGKLVGVLQDIEAYAFSEDGKFFVTGKTDGTVTISLLQFHINITDIAGQSIIKNETNVIQASNVKPSLVRPNLSKCPVM